MYAAHGTPQRAFPTALLTGPSGGQHLFDRFAAGHAGMNAERLGFGCAADDFGLEEIFGFCERIGGCPAGDGDGLIELGGYIEGVNAAADDAGRRLNRAALAADPALAHADRRAAGELHLALSDSWKIAWHSKSPEKSSR